MIGSSIASQCAGNMTAAVWAVLATLNCILPAKAAEDGIFLGSERTPGYVDDQRPPTVDLERVPTGQGSISPLLINGKLVDRSSFPAILRMKTGGTCTAAIVGRAAVLTAAHCVNNFSKIKFAAGNGEVVGKCEHAVGFDVDANPAPDWALCLLEYPVMGIKYESVTTKFPELGTRVVLIGFGCTAEGVPTDRRLRVGVSTTTDESSVFGVPADGSLFIRSPAASGDAIICPGDSGGPLFLVRGSSLNNARAIAAVASHTLIPKGISSFGAFGSSDGKRFLRRWTSKYNETICGFNQSDNCS